MNCPKCGFQQEEGPECLRCGLIFMRYHASTPSAQPKPEPSHSSVQRKLSFVRFYRIFRWVSLAVLIVALILIFRTSPPPQIVVTPDAAQRAETKIQEFQSFADQGAEKRLEMDESELNGWLNENLMLKTSAFPSPQSQESAISLAKKALAPAASDDASLVQAQSSVRDVRIQLLEDSLRLYVIFDFHGMDLSLMLDGRLVVRDGYLRLEPTSGRLGSLPLMAGTLQGVASRLFDSPENKEKFLLPPNIRDVQIEHGMLVVTSR